MHTGQLEVYRDLGNGNGESLSSENIFATGKSTGWVVTHFPYLACTLNVQEHCVFDHNLLQYRHQMPWNCVEPLSAVGKGEPIMHPSHWLAILLSAVELLGTDVICRWCSFVFSMEEIALILLACASAQSILMLLLIESRKSMHYLWAEAEEGVH